MPVVRELAWINGLKLEGSAQLIAGEVLKEIKARLGFLNDVGLDYLTLSRAAATLSGGEAQRIRLATQIGSGLVGVMYVLDEPSIGLHQQMCIRDRSWTPIATRPPARCSPAPNSST